MKRLSEYKDEQALDMLADLIDPVVNIFGDEKVANFLRNGNNIKAVQIAIKNHSKDVITMLAILEGVPREEYHCNLLTLPKVLLNIFNDPDLMGFFDAQGEMALETPSGSATANIEEEENTL